ncbi:uncharacterized protein LOC122500401 [Leptopilina heterotoma]|uniref:uncharacterized protein LOC122500401 n=1 Tax=Leptopilina heterotoma TaxID=63436 RepID=UPI001CA94085|nr:uncharacterized protein LOC122500401 [Leptopilina heterotoma]XP_043465253.1 uncharacterized protein LOC122500401 [Leptopilina heterotoma]
MLEGKKSEDDGKLDDKENNDHGKMENKCQNQENINKFLDSIQLIGIENSSVIQEQEKNNKTRDVIEETKVDQVSYSKLKSCEFSDKSEQLKIVSEMEDNEENMESTKKIQQLKIDDQLKNSDNTELGEKSQELKIENDENEENQIKFKPIKNLKFCGMRDPVHPALFIENFEYYAAEENLNEEEKQNHFVNSLRQYAAIWLSERGHGTYEEMKTAFLSFYWSSDKQTLFTQHLNTGKYMRKCRLSMGNYFFKHAIGAKYLDSSPSEKEIIEKLIKHYDKHIEEEIIIQKAQSIEEVIDILKRIDILKGTNKMAINKLSKNVSRSIIMANEKNSLNLWGWLFLLLAVSSVGLSFFSKIFMTK